MSATRTRKTRPVYPAAESVAKWVSISSVTFQVGAMALLSINGQTYMVAAIKDGKRIVGYRLEKGDKSYDVCLDGHGSCECMDFLTRTRPGGCKHLMAMRTAVAELNPVA